MLNEKLNSESNTKEQNEYQDLINEVLSVLKGKRVSLCKEVLRDLIRHGIDKKSTIN